LIEQWHFEVLIQKKKKVAWERSREKYSKLQKKVDQAMSFAEFALIW
jgi:hypothetical protein